MPGGMREIKAERFFSNPQETLEPVLGERSPVRVSPGRPARSASAPLLVPLIREAGQFRVSSSNQSRTTWIWASRSALLIIKIRCPSGEMSNP